MNLSMSREEQEAFLAAPRVGIFAFNQGGDSPLQTPMWFVYDAGTDGYWFMTDAESRKNKLLFVGSPISLLVQKDSMPHKYVTVRGQVTSVAEGTSQEWHTLAAHYKITDTESVADSGMVSPVTVHVKINRWTSYDESKHRSADEA